MTPPESAPLKCCPFCGSTRVESHVDDERATAWTDFIVCMDCLADGPACPTPGTAIAAWNTRAVDSTCTKCMDRARLEGSAGEFGRVSRILADTSTVTGVGAAIAESQGCGYCDGTCAQCSQDARAAIAAITQLIDAGRP